MNQYKRNNFCQDCNKSSLYHFSTWLDELIANFTFFSYFSNKLEKSIYFFMEKIFVFLRIASLKKDFSLLHIHPRTSCFIKEGRKKGIEFKMVKGPFGYTNFLQARKNKKTARFEGLPTANFASKYDSSLIDNKEWVKKKLESHNFPLLKVGLFIFFKRRKL